MGAPVFDQFTFRFRNDNGSETGATWLANVSTAWSPYYMDTLNNNYRLRMVLREVGAKSGWTSLPFYPYFSLNGSAYNKITATTPIQISLSSNFAQGDDCTRQVFTTSTGWLIDNNGMIETVDGCVNSGSASARWEVEFSFKLDEYQLDYGDEIEIRVYQGSTALSSYYETPKITLLNKPPEIPTLISPQHLSQVQTSLPKFQFYSEDADGDSLEYQLQLEKMASRQAIGAGYIGQGPVFVTEGGEAGMLGVNRWNVDGWTVGYTIGTRKSGPSFYSSFKVRNVDAAGNICYILAENNNIYTAPIPFTGTSVYTLLSETSRSYRDVTIDESNMDVYVCVYGGDIYKRTGGAGSFAALSQTSRNWRGLSVNYLNQDVYACVYSGDIYKRTGGIGNFLPLGVTSRAWLDIEVDPLTGTLYAVTQFYIFKMEPGESDFSVWQPLGEMEYEAVDICNSQRIIAYSIHYDAYYGITCYSTLPMTASYELILQASSAMTCCDSSPSTGEIWVGGFTSIPLRLYAGGVWTTKSEWNAYNVVGVACCDYNNNIYIIHRDGSFYHHIYYQVGGSGTPTLLFNGTSYKINSIATDHSNGDVFFTENVSGWKVYKQTGGSGNFVDIGISTLLGYTPTTISNVTIDPSTHNMYMRADDDVYVRYGGAGNFSLLFNLKEMFGIYNYYLYYGNGYLYAINRSPSQMVSIKPDGTDGMYLSGWLQIGNSVTYDGCCPITYSGHNADFFICHNPTSNIYQALLGSRPKSVFYSSQDIGFENITTPLDPHPFNEGDTIEYSLQVGNELAHGERYLWGVRAISPSPISQWSKQSDLSHFLANIEGVDISTSKSAYLEGTWVTTAQSAFMVGRSHIINSYLEGDYPRSRISAFIPVSSTAKNIRWDLIETMEGWIQYRLVGGVSMTEYCTYSVEAIDVSENGKTIVYSYQYYETIPEVRHLAWDRVRISTDFGKTFSLVSSIPLAYTRASVPTCRGYTGVSISHSGERIVVAGSTNGENLGFYYSSNGGSSWSAVETSKEIYSAVISGDGSTLWITANVSGNLTVYKSTNQGGTWTDVTPSNFDGPWSPREIEVDYDGSGAIVLYYDDIYYTTDGGVSWTKRVNDASTTSLAIRVNDDGTVFAYVSKMSPKKYVVSENSGASWTNYAPSDLGVPEGLWRIYMDGSGDMHLLQFASSGTYSLYKSWDNKTSFYKVDTFDSLYTSFVIGVFQMSANSFYHPGEVREQISYNLHDMHLYVGREELKSSIHAYISAGASGHLKGYLRGIGHAEDNVFAYTSGVIYTDDSSQVSCYMFGGTLAMSSISAYIDSNGQILVPNGDVSSDDWKNESGGAILYPSIADDYDYTYVWKQDVQVNDAFEVSLSDPFGIVGSGDHYLIWKIINIGIEGIVTLKCEIYDGLTLVKSDTRTIETFPIEYIIKLTSGEVANISDYYNLTAKVTVVGVG